MGIKPVFVNTNGTDREDPYEQYRIMETTEKKLPKHLQAAANNLEKQIVKYQTQIIKLNNVIDDATAAVESLEASISALQEQIKRLKGE